MKYDGWTLTQIANDLDAADRINTGEQGETALVITVTDTVARQIAARLREIDVIIDRVQEINNV